MAKSIPKFVGGAPNYVTPQRTRVSQPKGTNVMMKGQEYVA